MPRHIIIKFLKIRGKEKVLKAAREKKKTTKTLSLREKLFQWQHVFHQKTWGSKENDFFFLFLGRVIQHAGY